MSTDPRIAVAQHLTAIASERFWAKVDKSGDCWLWRAAKTGAGYGAFGRGANLAHRIAYRELVGPIPHGLMLDHQCRNRACVNPDHLAPVTNKLNQENRSGPPANSTSGVRGVSWAADHKKWRASVRHHGKRYHGGHFATLEEAEAAAIALRNSLYTNNLADRLGESA